MASGKSAKRVLSQAHPRKWFLLVLFSNEAILSLLFCQRLLRMDEAVVNIFIQHLFIIPKHESISIARVIVHE